MDHLQINDIAVLGLPSEVVSQLQEVLGVNGYANLIDAIILKKHAVDFGGTVLDDPTPFMWDMSLGLTAYDVNLYRYTPMGEQYHPDIWPRFVAKDRQVTTTTNIRSTYLTCTMFYNVEVYDNWFTLSWQYLTIKNMQGEQKLYIHREDTEQEGKNDATKLLRKF